MCQGTDLLTLEDQRRVRNALENFREQHPDSVREVAVKSLLHGVAAHHAGCLPTWKAFIEELFQQGLIKVVFATETLAAGINMPARYACVHLLQRIESFVGKCARYLHQALSVRIGQPLRLLHYTHVICLLHIFFGTQKEDNGTGRFSLDGI